MCHDYRPADVEGQCNAWLGILTTGTHRCELPAGHEGMHREVGHYSLSFFPTQTIETAWEHDERLPLEDEDSRMRGYHDGNYGEPPGEPGESYLAAYCVGVEEVDDMEEEKAEKAAAPPTSQATE